VQRVQRQSDRVFCSRLFRIWHQNTGTFALLSRHKLPPFSVYEIGDVTSLSFLEPAEILPAKIGDVANLAATESQVCEIGAGPEEVIESARGDLNTAPENRACVYF
jgi:hypothetical protein